MTETPKEMNENFLRGILHSESKSLAFESESDPEKPQTPTQIIDSLVKCGLLERKTISQNLQFAYDPVAEIMNEYYEEQN